MFKTGFKTVANRGKKNIYMCLEIKIKFRKATVYRVVRLDR